MHEGSIAAAVIQEALAVMEREGISTARQVTVRIGRLHHVVADVLQNYYRQLKRDHASLRRSTLRIEFAAVRIRCRRCQQETELSKAAFYCPACGTADGQAIEICGGQELDLVSITGNRPD